MLISNSANAKEEVCEDEVGESTANIKGSVRIDYRRIGTSTLSSVPVFSKGFINAV